ncbi:thioredoxin family protein [Halothiobacillus sp. DCM-1]|uniref:thioredoxin family protein n=1 Tax=Halothiobacillus sp. DCM-1 TaxID=3112558 RepID=UPI0032466568
MKYTFKLFGVIGLIIVNLSWVNSFAASPPDTPERVGKVAFVDHLSNLPADLAAMQEKKIPMLLFFHATYCGYCQKVDDNFLIPMRLDPEFQGRLLIRRVMIDSDRTYIGLDGKPHGYEYLANQLNVRGVPYILFIAPDGSRITSIQGTAYDYYGYYLTQDVNLATACAKNPDPAKCDGRKDGPSLN